MAKKKSNRELQTVRSEGPFNSALESGLRALCILYEAYPRGYDTQRLVYFDYLVVHSADVEHGPESLHPATPFRSNEWIVRRHLVDRGLRLLIERGLVASQLTDAGILYRASETAGAFVACLKEPYTKELKKRARWVVNSFGQKQEVELVDYFNENLDRWGAEFEPIGDWEADV